MRKKISLKSHGAEFLGIKDNTDLFYRSMVANVSYNLGSNSRKTKLMNDI